MTWPVHVLHEKKKVQKINWKTWGVVFFLMSLFYGLCYYSLNAFYLELKIKILSLLNPLCVFSFFVFFAAFFLRIYFYGMLLSNYDAYQEESKYLMKKWTSWANEKLYVIDHKLFTPQHVDIFAMVDDKPINIHAGQSLSFDNVADRTGIEEYFYSELLFSVRERIKSLEDNHSFEVVFVKPQNNLSYSVFKACWLSTGFVEHKLMGYQFMNGHYADTVNTFLDNVTHNVIHIVVCVELSESSESNEYSEFASIFLLSTSGAERAGVIYRPLSATAEEINNELNKMMTYQPGIYSSNHAWLSGMSINEQVMVGESLRNIASRQQKNWECPAQDINMALGNLGHHHSWLSLAFALDATSGQKAPQLMISKDGCMYCFNRVERYSTEDGEEKGRA
ncbi:hypothetical protein [Lonsdalea quercina]|uniref:hypothetical protein n=1 Tax=Lonsdalea quercina TaxID=71657 RepID=UPI0039771B73